MSCEGVSEGACAQLRSAEVDDVMKRLASVARAALGEPRTGECCIYRIDEFGNRHDSINWSAVRRIYGCAIYISPPDYSYRIIIVPGAVISYVHDGARSYCSVYDREELLPTLLNHPFSEVHVWEWPPDDVDTARAVCLR